MAAHEVGHGLRLGVWGLGFKHGLGSRFRVGLGFRVVQVFNRMGQEKTEHQMELRSYSEVYIGQCILGDERILVTQPYPKDRDLTFQAPNGLKVPTGWPYKGISSKWLKSSCALAGCQAFQTQNGLTVPAGWQPAGQFKQQMA